MKVYSHNIVDHRTSGYVSFWWWIWTNILGIVNRDKLEGLFRWLSNLLGSTLGVSLFTYQDVSPSTYSDGTLVPQSWTETGIQVRI